MLYIMAEDILNYVVLQVYDIIYIILMCEYIYRILSIYTLPKCLSKETIYLGISREEENVVEDFYHFIIS